MTQTQIIAVIGVALAAAYAYGPQLKSLIPEVAGKSPLLEDLETVTRIRKTYNSQEVAAACQQLLEALLQVKT